jgi:hypothetical protein
MLFSLNLMKDIELAVNTFRPPKNFDYRALIGGSHFGILAGQKMYHFKIAFTGNSAEWVKERKWADDQKFTKTKDGVIITFTSTQFEKVVEWMLSRGSTARPLSPELLVNTWQQNIKEMQNLASVACEKNKAKSKGESND